MMNSFRHAKSENWMDENVRAHNANETRSIYAMRTQDTHGSDDSTSSSNMAKWKGRRSNK